MALSRWGQRARRPRNAEDWRYGYADSPVGHIRTLLDLATRSLRRTERRQLCAAIHAIDELVLARTVNDPFARSHLPWWERRIEI